MEDDMLRKKCAIALSMLLIFSSLSYSPAYAEIREPGNIANQEVLETSVENTDSDRNFPNSELLSAGKDDLEGNVLEQLEESGLEMQVEQKEAVYDVSKTDKSVTYNEDYDEAVFNKTVSVDGISVNVYADSGVFPKTASIELGEKTNLDVLLQGLITLIIKDVESLNEDIVTVSGSINKYMITALKEGNYLLGAGGTRDGVSR